MPLYEYQCAACGCRFEELVSAQGQAPACPACQSAQVARILSAVNCPNTGKSIADNPASGPFPTGLGGGGCGGGGGFS
ncbi:hypothetical protein NNJEOMEG_01417 [Fundidesulfovibrio magnetotacticus]|uniref:Putative regulatory protein FmdB zinc ribbon domain-containing protein n=1 Tax=Fundidesulfovibrio magnetotacticus TaxID=2730080 RepID=A0A6V8LLM5_9BACT|nr:zinc ribbon domain-containing protein [Fundidesulfovibrio magnetotacticus]GFK93583.1 hypothetical protein NNJEOMEG_01417 [Fundidesulfovibrio magnetotacticus]